MAENKSAKVRLQALATLDGLGGADLALLKAAWKDQHAAVREHAVRLAEGRAGEVSAALASGGGLPEFSGLAGDESARVRYQLAFTLGEIERGGSVLAKLVRRDFNDELCRLALLCSLPRHVEMVATELFQQAKPDAQALRVVFATAAANADGKVLEQLLRKRSAQTANEELVVITAGTLEGLRLRKVSWSQYQQGISEPGIMQFFERAFGYARGTVGKREVNETGRLTALELCGQSSAAAAEESKLLRGLLVPQESQAVQKSALAALRRISGPAGAETLVEAWPAFSPALRGLAFEAFVGRRDWLGIFLDGVQSGKIPAGQITPAQRQQLLNFPALEVKHRAEQLFKPANQDRQALVKKYLAADRMVGRRDKGKEVFEQNCAACHRLGGLGQEIGPDLGMVGTKATDALLMSILDPNQAMEERYTAYTAELSDGEEVNGVVVAETPAALTLKTAAGTEVVVNRSRLKSLRSSGLSLMPEGLEAVVDIQGMADLLAFLRKPQ
ncbi:MAG: c-type cytochrome, partial [Verrucomicrobiota bacterium]